MNDSAGATVAACLIVRDEAEQLAECLRSVVPFATEIVVADTGSSDDTVAIAEAAGARVIRIGWTDDFAAARNAALAACTADWVLSLDADERAEGEPDWLSALLDTAGDGVDALSLLVTQAGGFNPRGHTRHRAAKLFRRERCAWRGRVHERLVRPDGSDAPATPLPDEALRLVHHGYVVPEVAAAKSIRNARLAESEVADLTAAGAPASELDRALLDLGRSRLAAGDRDGGRAALIGVRERTRPGAEAWLWAADFLAWDAVRHREADAADAFARELGAVGAPADYLRHLAAQIAYLRGDTERGDALAAAITMRVTVTGRPA